MAIFLYSSGALYTTTATHADLRNTLRNFSDTILKCTKLNPLSVGFVVFGFRLLESRVLNTGAWIGEQDIRLC